jgi:hypothetical protein
MASHHATASQEKAMSTEEARSSQETPQQPPPMSISYDAIQSFADGVWSVRSVKHGVLHNLAGYAVFDTSTGTGEYYINGINLSAHYWLKATQHNLTPIKSEAFLGFRDANGLWHGGDMPALSFPDGAYMWMEHGLYHSTVGPAIYEPRLAPDLQYKYFLKNNPLTPEEYRAWAELGASIALNGGKNYFRNGEIATMPPVFTMNDIEYLKNSNYRMYASRLTERLLSAVRAILPRFGIELTYSTLRSVILHIYDTMTLESVSGFITVVESIGGAHPSENIVKLCRAADTWLEPLVRGLGPPIPAAPAVEAAPPHNYGDGPIEPAYVDEPESDDASPLIFVGLAAMVVAGISSAVKDKSKKK